MASVGAPTITIDRAYYDALRQRAQFDPDSSGPNVMISRVERDRLRSIAKQYANLRLNLLRGGVDEDAVDILSQDDHPTSPQEHAQTAPPSTVGDVEDGGARLNAEFSRPPSTVYDQPTPRARIGSHQPRRPPPPAAWADIEGEGDDEETSYDVDSLAESPVGATQAATHQRLKPSFDRHCTRTLQLSNLADGTTQADITSAIRGGILLDIFLRTHERSAAVSFLHAVEARRFYDHVRRNDLYIRNKRVEIKWSERQFVLPGHVANKIASGASRNLVIYKYDNRHTEENIRDDLDHIHNLAVVKIEFRSGNCYVGLNSVHNAIYARQCMMSRFRYKGTKIDWDVDECAQPYPKQPAKPRKEAPPPKKATSGPANRFQLLNIDGGDDEELDDLSATFQSKKTVGIAA